MIGHVGAAAAHAHTPQQTQAPKPVDTSAAAVSAQPASQTPSSAEASKVVQPVPDSDNGRGADLQPQLNQTPQGNGTSGVNADAVKILEDVQQNASSKDFRTELNTQLEAAGHDPAESIVDIRV